MNTQKNAAWYRHQSWHRQTIIPALMPCSNGAWRFLPLPDRAKHKQKKARNYAGLAAFHAIRCLAVPDAESFPLDHQQLTQVRVVKGICFDRHRPLPSLLPSGKQVLCWRGFTRHRLIINQRLGYRSQSRGEQVGLLGKLLRIGLLQLRQVVQLPADARQVFEVRDVQQ